MPGTASDRAERGAFHFEQVGLRCPWSSPGEQVSRVGEQGLPDGWEEGTPAHRRHCQRSALRTEPKGRTGPTQGGRCSGSRRELRNENVLGLNAVTSQINRDFLKIT